MVAGLGIGKGVRYSPPSSDCHISATGCGLRMDTSLG